MHIQKFTQRLCALASSPKAIDTIITTLVAWVASQRVTRKDLAQLVQQLHALGNQKPQLRASRADVLPSQEKYEFVATDELGIEVVEGDLRYKRTFLGDIDKLLQ